MEEYYQKKNLLIILEISLDRTSAENLNLTGFINIFSLDLDQLFLDVHN